MKYKNTALWALSLLMAGISFSAYSCPISDDKKVPDLSSAQYDISVTTIPAVITVGELFKVDLEVCRKDGAPFNGEVTAAATMPAHKHGMNYQPEVIAVEESVHHMEGFAFHMLGSWQFAFQIRENGKTETILLDYDLKPGS
ncbi:MAG: hypothetical protein COB93_06615 [Sneathiella sp.]|nr:MAG: hypothetical protein COB93_06615 [Sneathiella sp.]